MKSCAHLKPLDYESLDSTFSQCSCMHVGFWFYSSPQHSKINEGANDCNPMVMR